MRGHGRRGFTAVELVTVLGLLAVLLTMATVGWRAARRAGRAAAAERLALSADLAARTAHAATGAYPAENSGHAIDRRLAEELGRYGFSPDGAAFDNEGTLLDPWNGRYVYDVAGVKTDADVGDAGVTPAAFWAARGVRDVRIFSRGEPDAGGRRRASGYVYAAAGDEGASADLFDNDGFLKAEWRGADGGFSPAVKRNLPRPGGGWRRWKEEK